MKRAVILGLVLLLVVSCTVGSKAKGQGNRYGRQIKIKFPGEERYISFNINPMNLETTSKLIHLQIKNPKHERLIVKVNLDLEGAPKLNQAIDYWVQEKKQVIKFDNLASNHQIEGKLFDIDGNYNGWIKIDLFDQKDWWQVPAGFYQGELEVSVRKHSED